MIEGLNQTRTRKNRKTKLASSTKNLGRCKLSIPSRSLFSGRLIFFSQNKQTVLGYQ